MAKKNSLLTTIGGIFAGMLLFPTAALAADEDSVESNANAAIEAVEADAADNEIVTAETEVANDSTMVTEIEYVEYEVQPAVVADDDVLALIAALETEDTVEETVVTETADVEDVVSDTVEETVEEVVDTQDTEEAAIDREVLSDVIEATDDVTEEETREEVADAANEESTEVVDNSNVDSTEEVSEEVVEEEIVNDEDASNETEETVVDETAEEVADNATETSDNTVTGEQIGNINRGYAQMSDGNVAYCVEEEKEHIQEEVTYTVEETDGSQFDTVFAGKEQATDEGFDDFTINSVAQLVIWSMLSNTNCDYREIADFYYGETGTYLFDLFMNADITDYTFKYWMYTPSADIFQKLISGKATKVMPEIPDQPEPETPVEPEQPEEPEVPEIPETPDEPVVPETPDVPVVPDQPEEPEIPVTPETPDVPEIPVVPTTPETPEVPEIPVIPQTPDAPVEEVVENYVAPTITVPEVMSWSTDNAQTGTIDMSVLFGLMMLAGIVILASNRKAA